MRNFITSLSDPAMLASLLAAVAMFATIVSLGLPLLKGDRLETRLKQVTTQREKLRRANRAALERRGLKKDNSGRISEITGKLNLQKMLEDPNVEHKLVQAGLRGPRPLAIFYFFRFVLPLAMAFLAFVYIFLINDLGLNPQMKIGAVVFGAAAGFYAPNLYVSNLAQKRQKSIMQAFPDALDMLLICVESGMSIELAFAKVGAEIGAASPDLAEEFQLDALTKILIGPRHQADFARCSAKTYDCVTAGAADIGDVVVVRRVNVQHGMAAWHHHVVK